jgi:hypothetical protein
MTAAPENFGRSVRHALIGALSATLLAACGGGDHDAEQPGASAVSTVNFEDAPADASRLSMGGGRRVPICTNASPECPPNLPPTQ